VPPEAVDRLLERARRLLPAIHGPPEAAGDLVAEDVTDWLIVLADDAVSTARCCRHDFGVLSLVRSATGPRQKPQRISAQTL
jgi:hypothetical protein